MKYDAASIGKLIPGNHFIPHASSIISELAFDTRKIFNPKATLFFALSTEKQDGHQYIPHAYDQGVRNFVVEQPAPYQSDFKDANFFIAKNSLDALQALAAHHRALFHIPIIGITGSNGKTTTKEWLFQLLSDRIRVKRNPKSYNSQIGVPLSLWNLNEEDDMGIFEAGISKPGEMEKLEQMIRPSIGIITNIGPAHDEGFENRKQKLKEKLRLFKHSGTLIYRRDHGVIHEAIQDLMAENTQLKTLSWGESEHSDILLKKLPGTIKCLCGDEQYEFKTATDDDAAVEDIMHCFATIIALHLDPGEFLGKFSALQHLPLRLELKDAINGCSLVYDCYNNDLRSLQIALDYQDLHKHKLKKSIILSDILESGRSPKELYRQVAEMLKEKGITKIVAIGSDISSHLPAHFQEEAEITCFQDTEAFLQTAFEDLFQNEMILLKGARKYEFERIGAFLERKVHGTKLEINLAALTNNLNVYRSQLDKDTKLMVMVKAFSYGTGSYEIANILQFHRVDFLAVAFADEGVALRKAGINLRVMVLNSDEESMGSIIRYNLEPEIFNQRSLKQFLSAVSKFGLEEKVYPFHLKLDTGMHRLGFDEAGAMKVVQEIKNNKQILVASIFSHLAAADDRTQIKKTEKQLFSFEEVSKKIITKLGYKPLRHIANTAGMVNYPEAHYDLVRLGLGLYGIDVTGKLKSRIDPVATLTTTISQITKVKAGDGIGYGFLDSADHDRLIATVGIGYADGYSRRFSRGVGYMLINGFKAPVVGNVCMDMTMLDVSNVPNVKEGDEVVVFGEKPALSEIAELIDTIPYEIVSNLSERIKRVYVDE